MDLENKTRAELVAIAKSEGLKGYSKLTVGDLRKLIKTEVRSKATKKTAIKVTTTKKAKASPVKKAKAKKTSPTAAQEREAARALLKLIGVSPVKTSPVKKVKKTSPKKTVATHRTQLEALSLAELKDMLREVGKPVGGNKAVLVTRLLSSSPAKPKAKKTSPKPKVSKKKTSPKPKAKKTSPSKKASTAAATKRRSRASLEELKISELKEILEDMGKPKTGVKAKLIERILSSPGLKVSKKKASPTSPEETITITYRAAPKGCAAKDAKPCADGKVCKGDTGVCVKDTAKLRGGAYQVVIDGKTIIGSKDILEGLKATFGGGQITRADGLASPPQVKVSSAAKVTAGARKKAKCYSEDGDVPQGKLCSVTGNWVKDTPARRAEAVLVTESGREVYGSLDALNLLKNITGGRIRGGEEEVTSEEEEEEWPTLNASSKKLSAEVEALRRSASVKKLSAAERSLGSAARVRTPVEKMATPRSAEKTARVTKPATETLTDDDIRKSFAECLASLSAD
jgi:hypothetical protein